MFVNVVIIIIHNIKSSMPFGRAPKQINDIFELDYQSCINLVWKAIILYFVVYLYADESALCECVCTYKLYICAGFTCDVLYIHCACVGAFCCCCRCRYSIAVAAIVAVVIVTLLLLLLLRFFLLWMFYQHGKWVEKTGESPPRVWRSMHTGYTQTPKYYIPLHFTLSLSLCVILFPSLFARRSALHRLCWAKQLLFSYLRPAKSKQ